MSRFTFWPFVSVLFALLPGCSTGPRADFYVSPRGEDTNPGTAAAPFATLARAQQAVRTLRQEEIQDEIVVLIRGGTYELADPLTFGPMDGGTADHAVTYAAWPGEAPIFSGGRTISGFQRIGGNRWTAQVPGVRTGDWWFRQLLVDGYRQPRARFPNPPELLNVTSVSEDVKRITFDRSVPEGAVAGSDVELVVYQKWSISRVGVRACEGPAVTAAAAVGWIGHGEATTTSPGKRAYLENAAAFLDEPGEWYLDRAAGVLTYVAREGKDPNRRRFVAPRLNRLVVIRGEPDRLVRNLHFRGLAFTDAGWELPAVGYCGIQAGHYGPSYQERVYVLPAAIEWAYARGCSLERCRVLHVGASGVALGPGCRRNRIIGCEVADAGGNGVMIGQRQDREFAGKPGDFSLSADWEDSADVPSANEVSDCFIHHCGIVCHGAVGIYDGFCADTRITHNQIADLPYTGVSMGFRWDPSLTSQRGCVIAGNHIRDVMTMLADGGGIYTLGYQPGSVLRGNLIHGVRRSPLAHGAPNNGVFFDQGSKGFSVEVNIIYDTAGEPIRFNKCMRDDFTWIDNTLGIDPTDPAFPRAAAGEAGLRPPYRSLVTDRLLVEERQ